MQVDRTIQRRPIQRDRQRGIWGRVTEVTLFGLATVKLLINAPGVYYNTDLETPAFNRDPAFIGDPASIRTLALSPCIY